MSSTPSSFLFHERLKLKMDLPVGRSVFQFSNLNSILHPRQTHGGTQRFDPRMPMTPTHFLEYQKSTREPKFETTPHDFIVGDFASAMKTPHKFQDANKMSAIKKAKQKLVTPPPAKRVVPKSGNESDGSTYTHPHDKLQQSIVKQLAQDIELFGEGYTIFFNELKTPHFLSKFCDARYSEGIEVYGTRGAPVRAQIRHRIKQWKLYVQEDTYAAKVLNRYFIQSQSLRKKQQLKTPQEDKELLQSSPSSSSSLSDSNSEEESSKGQQPQKIARKKRNVKSKESPQRPRDIFPDTINV